MSAFYAMAYADRVELLTDGAMYRDDGTLTGISTKVFASDALPLAVTGRGENLTVAAFCTAVLALSNCADSFDAALDRLSEFLRKRQVVGVAGNSEILIAGISESHGPSLWFFTTHYGYPQFEPFVVHVVGREFGGGNALTAEEIAGLPNAENGLAKVGPVLFEAMRRKPGLNPAAPHLPPIYGVGGRVDLTVVNASGATTTRLHTWPEDTVGQCIDPLDGDVFDDGTSYDDGTGHA